MKLLKSQDSEILISGPAGTGKSLACLQKLHRCANQYCGSRFLIVRKTRESLSESALFTYERYVLGQDNPMCSTVQRRVRQIYRYPNGSEVVVGGMDKSSKIMSTEFDLIYAQEAIELAENDWEALTTRLRNGAMPYQALIADTNPDRPLHWLKQRCDSGRTRLLESRHEDNPMLWNGRAWTKRGQAYMAVLDALTGARKERLRHGRWVQAEGVVYSEWDAVLHLLDRFEIPTSWRRFRVVDFGFTNPFVCQWWAIDPDGRMYLYREIYMSQRTVKVHAEKIKTLSVGEQFEATVCDHDAEDMATLRENGLQTQRAIKDVRPGIDAVKERLKRAGDGRPRLFILRDSVIEVDPMLVEKKKPFSTVQEFDGYAWSKPADGRAEKEEPLKVDDHGLDALRYAVMHVTAGKPTGGVW